MIDNNSFKTTDSDETKVQIGNHEGIKTPFFAPEIKNWHNDLHVALDYRDALDDHNPILVPAWDWPRLREKNIIRQRKEEDGETPVGEKEIKELEKNHPLIHFFPPELFAFRGKTNILRKYLLKRDKEAKSEFKDALQDRDIETALEQIPKFSRPFIRSNFNPVLNDFNIKKGVPSSDEKPEEIWKDIPDSHYDVFFGQIANEAMDRPSAVVVPPVPLISQYDSDLITAVCKANSKMSKFAQLDGEPRAYFHLYLHYAAFSDESGVEGDTASRALKILQNEVKGGEYAGIAVTIYKGEEVFESSTAPRVETFFHNLSSFAEEQALPVICPRSEWLGFWATDSGIDGFSSLLNGNWVYRSGGAVDDVDKYGYTMVPQESRSLKLRSDNGADIEEHIENGGISGLEELPDVPPKPSSDSDPGDELQSRYGTPYYYRRHFGKPQKMNHIWEARQVRSGENSSARARLEESKNEYVEFEEESE